MDEYKRFENQYAEFGGYWNYDGKYGPWSGEDQTAELEVKKVEIVEGVRG